MTKISCLILICAAHVPFATRVVAQSKVPPSRVVQFMPPVVPGSATNPVINATKTPPPYCNPCLYYGGDLDPTNSQADTFANENILPGGSAELAQIYSPFRVPKGQTWKVTGLFINSLSYPTAPDPLQTPWEIRTGIPLAGGTGGTLVAHGTAKVKMIPTGRNINGTPEFTFIVKWTKPVVLPAGKYWENVTLQCTNPNNSQCTAQGFTGFLESDMESKGGFHGYGPAEPWDDGFWNAPVFGLTWANVYQVHLQRGFPGGDAFSAGVIGTK
jgi:hypothetical protein